MEKSQAKPTNAKRQHDENYGDLQRKMQRFESCDEKSDQITKITDLDDFCLENIFDRLNLKDLLSVAEANKFLLPTARHVYKRNFGTKSVRISGCDDLRPNTRANARTGIVNKSIAPRERISGSINVRELKYVLSFLRCFGPSITRLSINYNKSMSPRYQYVHQYVRQYCAESLLEISFRDMPNIKLQHSNERPLANVVSVNIFGSHVGKMFRSMTDWFPNLRSLHLSKIHLIHRFANTSFPHLENLHIFGNFPVDHLAAFLPMNRQLRSVNFSSALASKLSITRLLDIIRVNTAIEILIIRLLSFTDQKISPIEIHRIVDEHPTLIELDLLFSLFQADDVIDVLRQLKSLKKLNFQMTTAEYEKLQSNLDDGWTSQLYLNFVTVRRATN